MDVKLPSFKVGDIVKVKESLRQLWKRNEGWYKSPILIDIYTNDIHAVVIEEHHIYDLQYPLIMFSNGHKCRWFNNSLELVESSGHTIR